MNESSDFLKRYAASKSKYFELPEGEEVKVKFLGAEEVPNHFDQGKSTCVRYRLEVDGTSLSWDRTSRDLAKQMAKFSPGDDLIVSRTGEKNRTKYCIRKAE